MLRHPKFVSNLSFPEDGYELGWRTATAARLSVVDSSTMQFNYGETSISVSEPMPHKPVPKEKKSSMNG